MFCRPMRTEARKHSTVVRSSMMKRPAGGSRGTEWLRSERAVISTAFHTTTHEAWKKGRWERVSVAVWPVPGCPIPTHIQCSPPGGTWSCSSAGSQSSPRLAASLCPGLRSGRGRRATGCAAAFALVSLSAEEGMGGRGTVVDPMVDELTSETRHRQQMGGRAAPYTYAWGAQRPGLIYIS